MDFDLNTLLIVGAGVIFVAALYLLLGKSTPPQKPKRSLAKPAISNKQKTKLLVTAAEAAKHNTEKDCWLIIKNKVYDVTSFIPSHPGGDAILRLAGNDNTAGFYGDQHPETVVEQVEEYYIGDLITDKKNE